MKHTSLAILVLALILAACEAPPSMINASINASGQQNQEGTECKLAADCGTGGCSGELCGQKGVVEQAVTICMIRPEFECLQYTTCGCVDGKCGWVENPQYSDCLAEKTAT